MEFTIFLKGILIGFVMAVPIGPIGIMCVRKTLTEGRLRGIVIGLGAATADLLYGGIAAFGLTVISNIIVDQRIWIRLFGGFILLYAGAKIFLKNPANPDISRVKNGKLKSYFGTLFLTLTNPITIFAFITVFTAFGLESGLNYFSTSVLIFGICIGSFLWFLTLSSGAILFQKKLNLAGLIWINRIAGVLIVFSGVIAIGSLL